MVASELFRALGDSIRLEMIQRLSNRMPQTITTISSGLGISRQGARKHLQILADAKVVSLNQKGRDTNVSLEKDTLEQGRAFIADLERQWDKRLEALRSFVDDDNI